ncbi:MAG TPA: YciI family protein [Bryobacteraceae bacterium]|nr:YciI family protein [Bryobacteraceae bacterium]
MQFMLILKASEDSEAGVPPGKDLMEAMGRFNEEMVNAGVLLAGEGLQASSQGSRVQFSGGKTTVVDGPFSNIMDLIAGFWVIQVKSKEEAIEWARRCPAPHGEHQAAEIEIRKVFEASDFPPDVFSDEEAAREQALRDRLDRK